MSSVVLGGLGTAVGGIVGGPVGANIGGAIGGAIGGYIDNTYLFAPPDVNSIYDGPRQTNLNITTSTEGATIPRLYGKTRMGGQTIWAANFEEVKTETTQEGGKSGPQQISNTQLSYEYFLSFAVAFCAGNERTTLGRVWADGKVLDLSTITYRFYSGTADQSPDSIIETIEGTGNVPAFRGICYLVFERLSLTQFGNRMPQITAEITRPIINDDPDKLENILRSVSLIPATGEFAYSTTPHIMDDGQGNSISENVHLERDVTNFIKSIEDLKITAPFVDTINIVIAWFGDDLRAGACTIRPKVENASHKYVFPTNWAVAGLERPNTYGTPTSALEVSKDADGRPIYGGTPSDDTVIECIQYLKDEGFRVCFYPFILMDVPADNVLPNPYSNNAATLGQPIFPWRGRITVSPAAGYTGTVDKTATAATQIDDFFDGTWGYNNMVIHYANLCDTAGGVDVFFIGSELVGLTQSRSDASTFPAVAKLAALAEDVKDILPTALVSYAADWSEYHSHRPNDGTNDVYFNMDPLWESPDIDFIAIDNYLPISDWRFGNNHLDQVEYGPTKIYDIEYLHTQIEGGEYYDYYYANLADRDAQTRTPIVDASYSKPWVFRQKDIRNWWGNVHYNRPGGTESGSPTSFTASNKPIYFSEFGCPAIDRGTNQPNVFFDPKSSESFLPYYSNGRRDDFIQRRYLEAMITYWRDNAGSMDIDISNMIAWTWDTRPYPVYPQRTDVWSDGSNYRLGHWLTGRLGVSLLRELVRAICLEAGLADEDLNLTGLNSSNAIVKAFIVENINSARGMLVPLQQAYLFDSYESEGKLCFVLREDIVFEEYTVEDMVINSSSALSGFGLTREKDTELPQSIKAQFLDEENAYQVGAVSGLKLVSGSKQVMSVNFPMVLEQEYVRAIADIILQEIWVARERGEIVLPASSIKLDPTDGIFFAHNNREYYFKINAITRGNDLRLTLIGVEPGIYGAVTHDTSRGPSLPGQEIVTFGRSVVYFADIPLLTAQDPKPWAPRIVGYQSPFPTAINVYRDVGTLELISQVTKAASLGELNSDFYSNRPWCWDRANELIVDFYSLTTTLQTVTETEVFAGANAIAVQNADGGWEIIQFVTAELIAPGRYKLTQLLRGQLGTETEMRDPVAATAPVFFIDLSTISALNLPIDQKTYTYEYLYGAAEFPTDSPFMSTQTLSFQSVGLLPYAPTRLWATRVLADGQVLITWQRRTRFNGDDFDAEFTPLNEEFEKYDLEVYSDDTYATLLRTEEIVDVTQFVYTAAAQTTDFGSVQTQFSIRLYQKSASIGRGRKAQQTIYTGI